MNTIDQLKRDEGWEHSVYPDSLGYWTIGCGFMVDARKGGGLDDEEIAWILQHRVDALKVKLRTALAPWFDSAGDARQGALVNMAYQMGVEGLLGFRNTLRLCGEGKWADVAPMIWGATGVMAGVSVWNLRVWRKQRGQS